FRSRRARAPRRRVAALARRRDARRRRLARARGRPRTRQHRARRPRRRARGRRGAARRPPRLLRRRHPLDRVGRRHEPAARRGAARAHDLHPAPGRPDGAGDRHDDAPERRRRARRRRRSRAGPPGHSLMNGTMNAHDLTVVRETGVIAVVRAPSASLARRAVDALVEGGVRGIEVTFTVPDAPQLLAELARAYGDGILLGAGTLTTPDDVARASDAGAVFLVSPGFSPALAEAMRASGRTTMMGALTPSEVM